MGKLPQTLVLSVLLLLFVGAALAVAQGDVNADAANPAAVDAAASAGIEPQSLMKLILESGITGMSFMVVLALFSFAGATIAIERGFALRKNVIIPASFCGQLKSLLAGEPSTEMLKPLCAETKGPMAAILESGLLRVGRPLLEVEKAMEDAAGDPGAAGALVGHDPGVPQCQYAGTRQGRADGPGHLHGSADNRWRPVDRHSNSAVGGVFQQQGRKAVSRN